MPELQIATGYDPAWPPAGPAARQARLPEQLRRLHQAILAFFLDNGGPPTRSWIQAQADSLALDPGTACADLAMADLVHVNEAGQVLAAYPFSGVPSGHSVQLAGRAPVWAMCAIDALGIPQMTGRDGAITAADPETGDQVRVEVSGGGWRWSTLTTTVLMARARECGRSAVCNCPHVNFFTGPDHAEAYLARHRELHGQLLGQRAAIELADAVFGALLRPG